MCVSTFLTSLLSINCLPLLRCSTILPINVKRATLEITFLELVTIIDYSIRQALSDWLMKAA